ncbi:MAG: amino acid permease [Actinomycetota bacterium]
MPTTERAGGLVRLAFVLSAVVCGLTALSYAELSTMFPREGGEYEYARHSMHRHGAFMVGRAMLAGLAVAFVLVGRFDLVASATDVAVYAAFSFVNFIVIALRLRRPDIVRAFRVPISIGRASVVPVAATVVMIWMVALLEFRAIAVAGGVMSLGLVMSLAPGSRPKTFG